MGSNEHDRMYVLSAKLASCKLEFSANCLVVTNVFLPGI
jgi:hypothetical protein